MNSPVEFLSGRGSVTREWFDYFPEYHYRQGFEQLRGEVSDDTVDEWIDQVIDHTPIGGSHGGLWKDDIPQLVADILSSSHWYETEITIRPEGVGDGYDYLVEWQYIDYDPSSHEWKPVNETRSGDVESI